MPFSNPVMGGKNFARVVMQSPNYVHGVSGWAIFENGNAEFHSIIVPPGTGGATIFVQGTAPVANAVGDLWYNSASGFEASQWNGAAWVPFQYGTTAIANGAITAALIAANTITAAQIAAGTITATQIAAGAITTTQLAANAVTAAKIVANTITAAQLAANTITAAQIAANTITAAQIAATTITAAKLAAGIIVAGIVDGTTITGATIVADGTSGQILVYSGVPAAGNLIASVSGAAGTDAHGNTFTAGLSVGANSNPQMLTAANSTEFALEFPLNTATSYSQEAALIFAEETGTNGKFGQASVSGAILSARTDNVVTSWNSSDSVSSANKVEEYFDTGSVSHVYQTVDNTGCNIVGTVAGAIPGTTPTSADAWHNLGTPTGWTSVTARYKAAGIKNMIVIDIMMTAPAGGATTASFPNSLPAAYQPTINRDLPIALVGTTPGEPRLFVGNTGSVSINGLPAGFTGSVGVTTLVPTD